MWQEIKGHQEKQVISHQKEVDDHHNLSKSGERYLIILIQRKRVYNLHSKNKRDHDHLLGSQVLNTSHCSHFKTIFFTVHMKHSKTHYAVSQYNQQKKIILQNNTNSSLTKNQSKDSNNNKFVNK